ncbi:MAG: twin-arginine translocase TatA/TatE family subunit [Bacteriovoracaceae bacterium]|jgi:sec-independent protein translocase protein TatA|nr:twin-arginine translocase TatA/TatE family subunit [Bacteriovoracaceae bacterium]
MFGLGMGELLILLLVVVVLFGAKRIPQLGSSLAQGIKNFQKGIKGESTKQNIEEKNDTDKNA